jgi:hypothetical protein
MTMRRKKMLSGAAAAAIALGGTVAVAETDSDEQAVTITIVEAPRTITAPEDLAFEIIVGSVIPSDAPLRQTATLKYSNALTDDAKITVDRQPVAGQPFLSWGGGPDADGTDNIIFTILADDEFGEDPALYAVPRGGDDVPLSVWSQEEAGAKAILVAVAQTTEEIEVELSFEITGRMAKDREVDETATLGLTYTIEDDDSGS